MIRVPAVFFWFLVFMKFEPNKRHRCSTLREKVIVFRCFEGVQRWIPPIMHYCHQFYVLNKICNLPELYDWFLLVGWNSEHFWRLLCFLARMSRWHHGLLRSQRMAHYFSSAKDKSIVLKFYAFDFSCNKIINFWNNSLGNPHLFWTETSGGSIASYLTEQCTVLSEAISKRDRL